jgi:hypothetical protein
MRWSLRQNRGSKSPPLGGMFTDLTVLENKIIVHIANCILNSAYKTNLLRFFREAPWLEEEANNPRIRYMLDQSTPHHRAAKASSLILDDTFVS